MSRRPRIDLAGYHHIINRGVNQTSIYLDNADYDVFLGIVCKACEAYKVVLHDYVLMSNHFHLLVETELDNLSLFMKHINSNYAIYFNKRTKRTGHLWQGRFYSRYINSDQYYYTLIRYIEQNPIEAGIVSAVGEYPYSLGAVIMNRKEPVKCARGSKLVAELSYENVQYMIGVRLDGEALEVLEEIRAQKAVVEKGSKKIARSQTLQEHFHDLSNKAQRNASIKEALQDGYTQAEIAKYLGLSRSAVCKIVSG